MISEKLNIEGRNITWTKRLYLRLGNDFAELGKWSLFKGQNTVTD